MSTRPKSPTEVAEMYGISSESVYKLMHQGAFGARGAGYRVLNPSAHQATDHPPQDGVTQQKSPRLAQQPRA